VCSSESGEVDPRGPRPVAVSTAADRFLGIRGYGPGRAGPGRAGPGRAIRLPADDTGVSERIGMLMARILPCAAPLALRSATRAEAQRPGDAGMRSGHAMNSWAIPTL
jgi:hypothetical protein